MKRNYVIIFLLFALFSCNRKDGDNTPPNPTANTLDAVIVSTGGVNLLGSYDSKGVEITKMGFELSLDSLMMHNKTIFDADYDTNNEIGCFVATGLRKNVKYYYRAFIQSSSGYFYGDTKSFVSDGSAIPKITSLSSEFGHISDTLSIYGKYLKDNIFRTTVAFSNVQATVLSVNDTIITCIVPDDMKSVISYIQVEIDNRVGTYSSFTLYKPVIESVEPSIGLIGDTITLRGDHFDNLNSGNNVFFGNAQAEVIESHRDLIKAIVPDDLQTSSEAISVQAQIQKVFYGENFHIVPPKINFVPQEIYADQEINIEGANFHPTLNRNIVTFEGVPATVISGDAENLTVKVPLGPFPRRKATLKLQVLDMVETYDIDLNIMDKWVMVSNDLPFTYYRNINNAVVANQTAYVITRSRQVDDVNYYLWKFNESDYSWEQHSLPFTPKFSAVAVSNNEKIYVYDAQDGNGFWEYNPIDEQWIQRKSFPGARRDYAMYFSINGDIYIGAGVDVEPISRINYRDIYRYSPATDSWERIADFPYNEYFMRIETSSFVINQIAYVGNGATNTGAYDYWSYNPTANEWKRIADFPDARCYTASFELNGFGYVTGGDASSSSKDCWRYDSAANQWIQDDDIGHIERQMHFAFSLNGKAYLGGGAINTPSSSGDSGFDFYEFIP